jgi:hypothetical protein
MRASTLVLGSEVGQMRACSLWYIAVLVSLSSSALSAPPGPTPPAADQQLARTILKELVKIRTTHDRGPDGA